MCTQTYTYAIRPVRDNSGGSLTGAGPGDLVESSNLLVG